MSSNSVRLAMESVRTEGRARVEVQGIPVVVFPLGSEFVAYIDECAHLGGPVCSQGTLHPYYTARVEDDGRVEPYFAEGGRHVIACPWHGWEYDLHDGQALADRTKSLRPAEVIVDGAELVVSV